MTVYHTIYHVETQGDYNALMIELEEKGCEWRWGEKPTQLDKFKDYGKDTYIYEEYGGIISFSGGYYFKVYRSNETLIEYKAKGENMTQEEMKRKEMKQNILDLATDVSVAVESFARDIKFEMKKPTVEADLQEAKSSAKQLIEKIDDYLESQKPEFKVGDYVTDTSDDNPFICKIEKIEGNDISGKWYCISTKYFSELVRLPISNSRLSTPEEIAEYEVALQFHKHGRKPFEVKEGDLIEYPCGQNIMIYHPDCFSKTDFLNDVFKLLKTAEEVSEWLENK